MIAELETTGVLGPTVDRRPATSRSSRRDAGARPPATGARRRGRGAGGRRAGGQPRRRPRPASQAAMETGRARAAELRSARRGDCASASASWPSSAASSPKNTACCGRSRAAGAPPRRRRPAVPRVSAAARRSRAASARVRRHRRSTSAAGPPAAVQERRCSARPMRLADSLRAHSVASAGLTSCEEFDVSARCDRC